MYLKIERIEIEIRKSIFKGGTTDIILNDSNKLTFITLTKDEVTELANLILNSLEL